MKESKASAEILCLFWVKPLQEKHKPGDKTAATVMQSLEKISCDGERRSLQAEGIERRHAGAFQMCKRFLERGNHGFKDC